MEQEKVINELKNLILEGEQKVLSTKKNPPSNVITSTSVDRPVFTGWHTRVLAFLRLILPEDSDFIQQLLMLNKNTYNNACSCVEVLRSFLEYYEKGFLNNNNEPEIIVDNIIRRIFSRFHRIVRQIRSRYNNRPTIDVNDEYDVQDLLHVILQLYFDDIRCEEWTPSYAGKSSRMDFLLKKEKIVIEVKKTRQGLSDKEVADQLIIDVDRYKVHPDCCKMICFVYDPEGRIANPKGLMNDLNGQHQGFAEIVVEPY